MSVTDFNGAAVHVDILPIAGNASYSTAVFSVAIPPAGFSTYFIEFSAQEQKAEPETEQV